MMETYINDETYGAATTADELIEQRIVATPIRCGKCCSQVAKAVSFAGQTCVAYEGVSVSI